MKLPSVYTGTSFKQALENATSGSKSHCRSVVNSASCELRIGRCEFQLSLTVPVPSVSRSLIVTCDVCFTGGSS